MRIIVPALVILISLTLVSCMAKDRSNPSKPTSRPTSKPTTQPVVLNAKLVQRLRACQQVADSFGPAYEGLYHAALPWYENWGNRKLDPADTWMIDPELYASELATALEHHKNFIADYAGSGFPMHFQTTLPDGRVAKMNYTLNLADGFDQPGHKYPLIIGLHGSGWLDHTISYSRGGKTGGAYFSVTPINQRGPWQIPVLNAYLDELMQMLPIDPDRIYLEGHSLGAMGVWEWAINNPERFAAISPRAGAGPMFQAIRLKNVPVWVIHGSADDAVLSGYGDQMVSALQSVDGTVKYSLLQGAAHNMPPDFDQKAVVDWYLQQVRSPLPAPADPVDQLGIGASGFSEPDIMVLPPGQFWKSNAIEFYQRPEPTKERSEADIDEDKAEREHFWRAMGAAKDAQKLLFQKVQSHGLLVSTTVLQEVDPATNTQVMWFEVPESLQSQENTDPTIIRLEPRKALHFYAKGSTRSATAHMQQLLTTPLADGYTADSKIWINPITPWRRGSSNLAEYWVELK